MLGYTFPAKRDTARIYTIKNWAIEESTSGKTFYLVPGETAINRVNQEYYYDDGGTPVYRYRHHVPKYVDCFVRKLYLRLAKLRAVK